MGQICELKPGERIDNLQRNGFQIIQNPQKFCFGMDAVLLSGFASASIGKNQQVLDLGTGTGILPILLAAKTEAAHLEALEIQEECADMARRSVILNRLEERIHITTGNLVEASSIFGAGAFDAVVTNPPYMNDRHGLKNPSLPKAIARHEVLCTLEDVIRESSRLLKSKHSLFMVHRPFRLAEIFSVMEKYRMEPKRMCLVHPYIDKEPNMVLLEAIKDANPMIKVEPPIIVYERPGVYTKQILEQYGY